MHRDETQTKQYNEPLCTIPLYFEQYIYFLNTCFIFLQFDADMMMVILEPVTFSTCDGEVLPVCASRFLFPAGADQQCFRHGRGYSEDA